MSAIRSRCSRLAWDTPRESGNARQNSEAGDRNDVGRPLGSQRRERTCATLREPPPERHAIGFLLFGRGKFRVESHQRMAVSDAELLEHWRGGDKEAGRVLFHRHFPSIDRFFRNKVPPADVKDLIQNTFVGCVEGMHRYRGESSFRTYLFGIARNQLLKFIRDRTAAAGRVDPDLSVSSIHALGLSPSSIAAARERHGSVLAALQRISVEHQMILELFYWEELEGPEIAEILDISPTTVRTRMHRARKALKAVLDELAAWEPANTDIGTAVRAARSDHG